MPTVKQLIRNARQPIRNARKSAALKGCPQRRGTCARVYRTPLLTILYCDSIKGSSNNAISHTGKILNPSSSYKYYRMFLFIMANTRYISSDFKSRGFSYSGNFTFGRVGFFGVDH
uniref:Ribosomal protein S12 n=2 Tax=Mesangiospermae TaxID=1437183 RepID=A0A172KD15_ORYMI|nr:ribosomal protein S12 [Oryza minuta]AMW88231.1 ribosomal protein S12 [Oryza minuta]